MGGNHIGIVANEFSDRDEPQAAQLIPICGNDATFGIYSGERNDVIKYVYAKIVYDHQRHYLLL